MKKFVENMKKKYPKAYAEALGFFFPTEMDLKKADLTEADLRKIELREADFKELICLNARVLYDFFDKPQIAIFVTRNPFFTFGYEILNIGTGDFQGIIENKDPFPNRTSAEMAGFEKAFGIREKQLK